MVSKEISPRVGEGIRDRGVRGEIRMRMDDMQLCGILDVCVHVFCNLGCSVRREE